jgi:hypothetical protein
LTWCRESSGLLGDGVERNPRLRLDQDADYSVYQFELLRGASIQ